MISHLNLKSFFLFAVFILIQVGHCIAQLKPNIIIFLADDQGWGDLGINGNTSVKTPHIDGIAKSGARFDRFYVAPLCAPTRAGLLTGRYHYRAGVYGVSNSLEFMNLDEYTLANLFKDAGYTSGCFGKWHNGSQYPYHPNGRGFDEFYGFLSGHYANYFNTTLNHNGKEVQSEGYITDDLTNHAISFIERNKNKAFLCYIPYNTPHSPFQVPDKYYDAVKERGIKQRELSSETEEPEVTTSVLAMTENIDWNVGRVLAKVQDLKLKENTIIIHMSDNGPNSWRWNGDMKGRKGMVDEGGVRAPFFISWPGKVKAGTVVTQNGAYIDILPTLADYAGLKTLKSKPLDGISLRHLIEGKAQGKDNRILFSSINKKTSVRQGSLLATEGALYNLANDPRQLNNLASQNPETYTRLIDTLHKWYAAITRNAGKKRYLPVGYPEFPAATLPSQDARLHRSGNGELSYSGKAPNSSFITNWTDTASFAHWDIDVHTAGKFQVEVLYTASNEEVSSVFNLSVGTKSIPIRFSEAYNPPLIASPDRSDRGGESLEKKFKPLNSGFLDLEKGQTELVLKAQVLKGKKMPDVKGLRLTLVK